MDTFDLKTAPEAVKAISGIIVLGDAWQNVDLFHALGRAIQLADDRNVAAFMARLRVEELVEKGKHSLLPGAPRGKELLQLLIGDPDTPRLRLQDKGQGYDVLYKKLRLQADQWHEQRTTYMTERLQQGRHPDTDPVFWNEWQEPAPFDITLPLSDGEKLKAALDYFVIFVGSLIICIAVGVFVSRQRKKRLGTGA